MSTAAFIMALLSLLVSLGGLAWTVWAAWTNVNVAVGRIHEVDRPAGFPKGLGFKDDTVTLRNVGHRPAFLAEIELLVVGVDRWVEEATFLRKVARLVAKQQPRFTITWQEPLTKWLKVPPDQQLSMPNKMDPGEQIVVGQIDLGALRGHLEDSLIDYKPVEESVKESLGQVWSQEIKAGHVVNTTWRTQHLVNAYYQVIAYIGTGKTVRSERQYFDVERRLVEVPFVVYFQGGQQGDEKYVLAEPGSMVPLPLFRRLGLLNDELAWPDPHPAEITLREAELSNDIAYSIRKWKDI